MRVVELGRGDRAGCSYLNRFTAPSGGSRRLDKYEVVKRARWGQLITRATHSRDRPVRAEIASIWNVLTEIVCPEWIKSFSEDCNGVRIDPSTPSNRSTKCLEGVKKTFNKVTCNYNTERRCLH
ncbi:hypothetical protein BgiMline_003005 [Biomphalaria glabrata]|nr:hypothetical protein BgiMline_011577 [Biomphalaria glabrata]